MNSILSFVVLLVFLTLSANAIFHVRPNGQTIFFHDEIEAMSYLDGEKLCKAMGGQYPKLESKQDVDELSELVMKHRKRYTAFWIPLKEDAQGRFTWTDGSPYNTSLAKRVFESGSECRGTQCYFLLDARRKIILSDLNSQSNVMCVISSFIGHPGDHEKSRKELESLESEVRSLYTNVEMQAFKFKKHVSQLFDMEKTTKQSLDGIQETLKKLRNLLSAE